MLSTEQAAQIKGMLLRGDKQHDIAAHFGVNGGRIAEVATGRVHGAVKAMVSEKLPPTHNGPRFIDPNAPLDAQVQALTSLIERPPTTSRIITFTPALAQWVLETLNVHNRPLKTRDVARYAANMGADRWTLTGDTIKFSEKRILRDGQNRLTACVQSGVPFTTHVVFGIEDAAFDVLDNGRRRTGSDAFAVAGIPHHQITAGAVRWLHILKTNPKDRSVVFENRALLQMFQALSATDRKLLVKCAAKASGIIRAGGRFAAPSLAALLFIFSHRHAATAERFADDLMHHRGNATKLLQKIKSVRAQQLGRIHEVQLNAFIVLTWGSYRRGRTLRAADLNWNDTHEFPEIA